MPAALIATISYMPLKSKVLHSHFLPSPAPQAEGAGLPSPAPHEDGFGSLSPVPQEEGTGLASPSFEPHEEPQEEAVMLIVSEAR
jgi:hypothetical protein